MNKVILIGRLARDPEVRYMQSGKANATFTIAVDRRMAKKGEGQPTADFIPVVCWQKLAEIVGNNLAKGRRVGVEGRMQVRSYDARDGSKRYVTEVVADEVEFLDSRKDRGGQYGGGREQYGADVADEEIPF